MLAATVWVAFWAACAPAVVVAAVDVIAVMTIAQASARFLGDRSQDRMSVYPKD